MAKALIVRGDQMGFNFLIQMIKDPMLSNQILSYYGKIMTKTIDPYYTKKEQGFTFFKLYPQKMFCTLYPVLHSQITPQTIQSSLMNGNSSSGSSSQAILPI